MEELKAEERAQNATKKARMAEDRTKRTTNRVEIKPKSWKRNNDWATTSKTTYYLNDCI